MTAPIRPADLSDDQLTVSVFASLSRVLGAAPIERKLAAFALMARHAAGELAAQRQQRLDDLLLVAEDSGLTNAVGPTAVQNALAAAFATEVAAPYNGSTFRDACDRADSDFEAKTRAACTRTEELAASTKRALSYLCRQNDLDRLDRFVGQHSPGQAEAMLAFVKQRRS